MTRLWPVLLLFRFAVYSASFSMVVGALLLAWGAAVSDGLRGFCIFISICVGGILSVTELIFEAEARAKAALDAALRLRG